MAERIEKDREKFIEIIKGKIKKDLKKYFKPGQIILPRKKGDPVAIPIPKIDLPTFRYGKNRGGVGQGPGEPGTDLGPIEKKPGEGDGEKNAGEGHGEEIQIEFTQEEILEILEAELPNILPKGEKLVESEEVKYTEIRKIGPESLRHRKRTYKKALRRQLASGEYNPEEPKIIPVKEDKRYRSWKNIEKPQYNALIVFMRDVSGSIGPEERDIISYICFLTELFLKSQYDELETAYIVHDTIAKTVLNQEEFLSLDFGGGTKISSGHLELIRLIREKYPPENWNIYVNYFSDGFNWGEDDDVVIKLLKEDIIPIVNQYAYGEITLSRWWWGEKAKQTGEFSQPGNYGHKLAQEFKNEQKVVWAELSKTEDAFDAFKKYYGKFKNNTSKKKKKK